MYGYLKIFAQESLGRPDLDVTAEIENIQAYLKRNYRQNCFRRRACRRYQAAPVFTNEARRLISRKRLTPPAATVMLKDLKALVRKAEKGKGLAVEKSKRLKRPPGVSAARMSHPGYR